MTTHARSFPLRSFWTLNKLVVLTLLGGFAMLLIEIRAMHQKVLGEEAIAWTPLVYSGLMLLGGAAGLALWDRGGRRLLFWGFALALVVGLLGDWLHTMGKPIQAFMGELSAWAEPIGPKKEDGDRPEQAKVDEEADAKKSRSHAPPALAPLTFVGLGLLGMLACSGRFQPNRHLVAVPVAGS